MQFYTFVHFSYSWHKPTDFSTNGCTSHWWQLHDILKYSVNFVTKIHDNKLQDKIQNKDAGLLYYNKG